MLAVEAWNNGVHQLNLVVVFDDAVLALVRIVEVCSIYFGGLEIRSVYNQTSKVVRWLERLELLIHTISKYQLNHSFKNIINIPSKT